MKYIWTLDGDFTGPYTPDGHLPALVECTATSTPIQSDVALLAITDFLNRGAIWDAFHLSDPSLIVKLTCPTSFSRIRQDDTHGQRFTELDARRSITTEHDVLAGSLLDLQNHVVPALVGLFGSVQEGREMWAMVMEHAGKPIQIEEYTEADK
jgi:hypothetical protein